MYDGTNIVTKSVSLGADVVYVAVNYRSVSSDPVERLRSIVDMQRLVSPDLAF